MPLEWLKQAGQEWTDQGQNAPVSEDQSSPPTPTPAVNSDSSDGGIRSVFKDWTAQENESQVEAPAVQPTKLPDQVVLKPVRTGDAKTLPLPDPNKPDTQQDSNGDPVISSPINVVGEEDKNKLDLTERLPSYEKFKSLNPTPQELNVYKHHSDNFLSQNGGKPSYSKEGDIETVRLATFENEGNVYAIPTQWNGKVLPFKEAVEKAKVGGLDQWPHLPVGNDPQAAEKALNDRYINDIHPIFDLDVNQREKQLHEEDVNPKNVLDLIGKHEAPGGYDIQYGESKPSKKLTEMTVNDVLALQTKRLSDGAKSSAAGRYQFIHKTLSNLKDRIGLTGTEVFDEDLQDRLAHVLLQDAGLDKFQAGKLSKEDFANNLSHVWASLPVVTDTKGANRKVKVGESYYSGDGLNKALVKPSAILSALSDEPTDEVYRDEHGNDFTLNSDGTLVPHK